MPFICLANANVADGAIQITDLWPNESQRNGSLDPPGQNRYLSRPALDRVTVGRTSGLVQGDRASANKLLLEGLGAYLLDHVEPGAGDVATTTVAITAPQAGDRLTIKSIVFEFAVGANDLVGKAGTGGDPFLVGLGANPAAAKANLILALNDEGDVGPAMDLVEPENIHVIGTSGAGTQVIVRPEDALDELVTGYIGDFTFVSSNVARLGTDNTTIGFGRMWRTNEYWTATALNTAVAAIMTRVDAGQSLLLGDLNTILGAVSADLDGSTNPRSQSVGTLSDVLSILAGRVYEIPVNVSKYTANSAQVHIFDPTIRGSFTVETAVFDSVMVDGVWTSSSRWVKHGDTVVGGDVRQTERGGVRTTFDSTQFQASLQTGQLSRFASGITLFPDAAVQARLVDQLRESGRQTTLLNQRVVTVYADDGSVLA